MPDKPRPKHPRRPEAVALGKRIALLRKRAQLAQKELAARVGTSTDVIGHIETGDVAPSLERISQIAQALDVPLPSLFGDHFDDTLYGGSAASREARATVNQLLRNRSVSDLRSIARILRAVLDIAERARSPSRPVRRRYAKRPAQSSEDSDG